MKKTYRILLITIMLLLLVVGFAACHDENESITLNAPENLAASGSTISWSVVANATSYEVYVDDGAAKTTENTYYNLDITRKGT